jgi:serine/threonine-protein kinase
MQAGDVIQLRQGSYVLREQLGGSSYGLVWSARGALGDVALKLVNRAQMDEARADEQVHWSTSAQAEIAFLRGLSPWDGRHIVRLLDSGEHDGLPVLALERLDLDLARYVARERHDGRALEFEQVLEWMQQLNQAVAKVHQYGWRYLDLKPSNVLLCARTLRAKLSDFGTNRRLADGAPHAYAGTANWQAPEQFFPDDAHCYRTEARTDYFALGALFYFLVTGGVQLRFCSECGVAYREHRTGGAYIVRERHGRALPPILQDDEAALFMHRIDRQAQAGSSFVPAACAFTPAACEAARLLRHLLAADPMLRPHSALEISRRLDAIRKAWQAQNGERMFFASLSRPAFAHPFGGAA